MRRIVMVFVTIGVLGIGLASISAEPGVDDPVAPQPSDTPPMDNARLGELLLHLDPELGGRAGFWTLTLGDLSARVITDENADRMRIVIGRRSRWSAGG